MDITTFLVNAIGFVATVFSIFMWVPQARITWQNRNDPSCLAGVSETTQWLSMIGYLLWGVFGVMIESVWVAAPSLVSFPLSIATIVIVRRGRRLVPFTRSIPIISMTEPLSVTDTTGSIPILSSGSIPILSSAASVASAILATTEDTLTASAYTPTRPIPILA